MRPTFTVGILIHLCFITNTYPKSLDETNANIEKVKNTVPSEIISDYKTSQDTKGLQPRQGFPGGPGGGGPGGPGGIGGRPGGPGGLGNNVDDGDDQEDRTLSPSEVNFVGSNVFKLVTSVWTGNLGGVVTGGLNLLNTRDRVNGLLHQFGVTTPSPKKNATAVAANTTVTTPATEDEDDDEDYGRELVLP